MGFSLRINSNGIPKINATTSLTAPPGPPTPPMDGILDSNNVFILDENDEYIEPSDPIVPPVVPVFGVNVINKTIIEAFGGGLWWGRPTLAENTLGEWLMVYREGLDHPGNDTDLLHIRFSDDYGATWSNRDQYIDGTPIVGFPIDPAGWPVAEGPVEGYIYMADNGDLRINFRRFDLAVVNLGTYQVVSNDNGLTWSAETFIDFAGTADDLNIFMVDDHFIVGGVIYSPAREYVAPGGDIYAIFCKSLDNGATWEKIANITYTRAQETTAQYIGGTSIIAMIRDSDNWWTYKARSDDMGVTWNVSEISPTFGVIGRARMRSLAYLRGEANWWTDPYMIMVGFEIQTPGSSHPRRNCIWLTHNYGEDWQGPFYIDVLIEDSGYSDVLYNPLTGYYEVVSYQGTLAAAELVQYTIEVTIT